MSDPVLFAAFRLDAARDSLVVYRRDQRWLRVEAFPREAAVYRRWLQQLTEELCTATDPGQSKALADTCEAVALACIWLARGTGQPPSERRN